MSGSHESESLEYLSDVILALWRGRHHSCLLHKFGLCGRAVSGTAISSYPCCRPLATILRSAPHAVRAAHDIFYQKFARGSKRKQILKFVKPSLV